MNKQIININWSKKQMFKWSYVQIIKRTNIRMILCTNLFELYKIIKWGNNPCNDEMIDFDDQVIKWSNRD